MLIIHHPKIIESETSTILQAAFESEAGSATLWFSTPKEYGQYLCSERGDAFLVALLLYAMQHDEDITVESPVSERLYYTLSRHFTKTLMDLFHRSHRIQIFCETDSTPVENAGGVGTGLSCGIDSFCTVTEHIDTSCPQNYRLTHLTFFNVGASGDYGGEKARELYYQRIEAVRPCANELGLPLITLDSNINEILDMNFVPSHTYRNVSGVLALQKLFKTYYYSSGYSLRQFAYDSSDSSHYDVYLLDMLSTETTKFYSSGEVYSRVEKTDIVAANPLSYKYLNVCVVESTNCSRCHKCQRTLTTLDILGKLDLYNDVFDIPDYQKRKGKYLGAVLSERFTDQFNGEIYDEIKRQKFTIKQSAYMYAVIHSIANSLLRFGMRYAPQNVKKLYWKLRNGK